MNVQGSKEELKVGKRLVSRRAVNIGAAWSVPVILTAVAAPTASASPGVVDPTGTAVLGSLVADKGEDSSGNRMVTLYLSFTNVVGTNDVRIFAVSGGFQWSPMPTGMVTVTSATTVPFVITRPGSDNSVTRLDVTYEVNGVKTTVYNVDVKNVVVPTGNH